MKKGKIKSFLKKLLEFLLNPRFLLCFGIAWMITNGWSYVLLGLGSLLKIEWMVAAAAAYMAFLWVLPTPEKLITFPIAIFLLRWWFPGDQKTLQVLRDMYNKVKLAFRSRKARKQAERDEKARKQAERDEKALQQENKP